MGHRSADERFAVKYAVDQDTGCWLWTGKTNRPGGYGMFWTGDYDDDRKVMILAHRWSFGRSCGPIPDGLRVCHRCDMPPCVNPDHLFVATQRGNVHDCIRKGRHRNGVLVLTPEVEAEIRSAYNGAYGQQALLARRYGTTSKVVASLVRDLPHSPRLTPEVEVEIWSAYDGSHGQIAQLARRYGTTTGIVKRIVRGKPRHFGRLLR